MSKHTIELTGMIGNLADGLTTASEHAWEAYEASRLGRANEAIGGLLPALEQLETYTALCKAIIALHRIGNGGAA